MLCQVDLEFRSCEVLLVHLPARREKFYSPDRSRALQDLVISGGLSTTQSAAEDRIKQLVDRLFELADSGHFVEPDFVAKTLNVITAQERAAQVWDCSRDGVHRRMPSAQWTPPWGRLDHAMTSLPEVEMSADVQEWAWSALEYGSLRVGCRQSADVRTPGGHPVPDCREAAVEFDRLAMFACVSTVTADDERWRRYHFDLPQPRHHGDGVLIHVHRRVHAGHDVTMLVEYGLDERCPQPITIKQDADGR